MMVAIKYNEDNFYSSEIYAKLGGLSVHELNYLEFQFLILIKFSLFVEKDLFDKYNDYLLSFQEEDNENAEDEEEDDKISDNENDNKIENSGNDNKV